MIIDAEVVPVYVTDFCKDKAVDDFAKDWKRSCLESTDEVL
ncbi:hypothetical protein [Acinetobacter bereziniae]|nr:hypothetical protein [Acinetobacter bereziniae]